MDKKLYKIHKFLNKHDWANGKIIATAKEKDMKGQLIQCSCGAIGTTGIESYQLPVGSPGIAYDGWDSPSLSEKLMTESWEFTIPFKEYLELMDIAKRITYE